MKDFALIDYKGKFGIIVDDDMRDDCDIEIGRITKERVIETAEERKELANHYGVPAYVGNDEELNRIFNAPF